MLRLGDEFVEFEVDGSRLSDIFFDNANQQVCTVRSNGAMGITAKGLDTDAGSIGFRTRDAGKINSLSFSTDHLIASVQRVADAVNFLFLDDVSPDAVVDDYKQTCKNAFSKILGLQWISDKQIVYITDQGLELYQLNPKKKSVKFIKSVGFEPSWFIYHPDCQLLICASGVTCSVLNPFIIQNGVIHRLCKFEADFGCTRWKPRLLDRDVAVASLYGKLYIMVLKFGQSENVTERLNLYLINSSDATTEPPKLAHSLILNLDGVVGVHVIDNVVLVHHKSAGQTLFFDIRLNKPTIDVEAVVVSPITVSPRLRSAYDAVNVTAYTPSWVIFTPDLVVDARFGIFARFTLLLDETKNYIKDELLLLGFIANRTNASQLYLNTLKDLLQDKRISVGKAAEIFTKIIQFPGTAKIIAKDPSTKYRLNTIPFTEMRVDYNAVVRSVLFPMKESANADLKFIAALSLEFLLVLKRAHVQLDHHFLAELLIRLLVEAGDVAKLKQLLQYRVIDDSKFLAFELTAIGRDYPELIQLAMDMLSRRGKVEPIVDIRLQQRRPIEALRALRDRPVDVNTAQRILDVAWESDDRRLKYTVFTTLRDMKKVTALNDENGNGGHRRKSRADESTRSIVTAETIPDTPTTSTALPEGNLQRYIREFRDLYRDDEMADAERRFRIADISGGSALFENTSEEDVSHGGQGSDAASLNDQQEGSVASDLFGAGAPG